MNGRRIRTCVVGFVLFIAGAASTAVHALGTAFTYQGQLQQNGSDANGLCDFQLILWDNPGAGSPPAGGNQIGGTQALSAVSVSDGVFTVQLDFGAAPFSSGSDRWLQIGVRCPAGSGSYQVLAPRQPLTAAPFALFANTVPDGSVNSSKLAAGAVMTSQLAPNAVTSAQIADGTITMNDLANGAVSTTKIGDGQVTGAKLVAPLSLATTAANSPVGAFDGFATGLDSIGVSGTADNGVFASGVQGSAIAGYGVVGLSNTGTGVLGQRRGNPALQHLGDSAPRGAIGPGAGVVGESFNGPGVMGTSSNGVGVFGHGSSDAGVKGMSDEEGVIGESTGGGVGVRGSSNGSAGVMGQSGTGAGVRGESVNGPGLMGSSEDGDDAILGTAKKAQGRGVHGVADDGNVARGVFGESADGVGVFGKSTTNIGALGVGPILGLWGATTGEGGTGVAGTTNTEQDDNRDAIGVRGVAMNGTGVVGQSGTGNGVYGKSSAVSTVAIAGVVGEALGNNNIGVRGVAQGPQSWAINGESAVGYAGYFIGKVHVSGALTAGVKPFKIDHPTDPANKYLVHAAVESSDMKNIYDGIVALDSSGQAVIELPAWFEALNRDFRYQLTCVGGVAPVYVAEEVRDSRFRIAGGTPGLKVSWQVTGIRKDAFAAAHPLVVELDKGAQERGRYLYPVEAGMPASLSVDHAKQAIATAQVQ